MTRVLELYFIESLLSVNLIGKRVKFRHANLHKNLGQNPCYKLRRKKEFSLNVTKVAIRNCIPLLF